MLKLKTSYIAYIQNYILIVLLSIFLLLLYKIIGMTTIFSIIFLIGLIFCLYLIDEPLYRRIAYTYEIGNDSIVETKGIITKQQTTIPYRSVSDIRLKKGVIGRIFNFGDVKVIGFRGEILLMGMKNPERVYGILKNKLLKTKGEV